MCNLWTKKLLSLFLAGFLFLGGLTPVYAQDLSNKQIRTQLRRLFLLEGLRDQSGCRVKLTIVINQYHGLLICQGLT